MKDLFEKCYTYQDARDLQATGFYPYFLPLEDTEGTEVVIEGHKLLMLGSNNYLGLTTHPRVRQAAVDAVEKFGTSCTGSRFLNGTLALHLTLEKRLANFVGKENALIFSTGMQVNLGVISSLVCKGEYVITDKDDHASIVDGARLSFGTLLRFKHNDMDDLERVLIRTGDAAKLVVVDGLYSMGGDIAPLDKIVPLCKKYKARLMVDDAHSMGVLGNGRGTAAHFGVTGDVDLIMGTFSKSFASLGGFIAGDADTIHYVQHHARSLIFSASIPAHCAMPVMAALDIIENEPALIENLWTVTERMRKGLKQLGFNTGASQTPVIPVIIGEDEKTFFAWKGLYDAGVYTNPVISPGVPKGMALLRTSYMATHTIDQIDFALQVFEQVGRKIGMI
ncbi:MAG: pyridoxal phosphate-dependent aminotransferase family protein [Anaerolineales bacterium]|nr:pyridoxal phosphate-dependent aminotransferase family protein [Anaerolineales bacterium]